jgi:hypothetical protein
MRFGDGGVVRPQRKVINVYEQKNQHKFIFAFLLLKGSFVTWQMGQERLLATSNESPILKNQIKIVYVEKKGIIFCDLSTTHLIMLHKDISEK